MESGTTVSPNSSPVTPDTGLRSHKIVAESLNCTGDNDDDVLQCMQSKSAWDVVNHNNFLSADGGMPYPVIDGSLGLDDPFLPTSTNEIFSRGDFNTDIEVMIGEEEKCC